MVLTRAFACATPVVASDIPGYRDVMTAETSVAVPPGDAGALAEAVRRCSRTSLGAKRSAPPPGSSRSTDIPGPTSPAAWSTIYDSARGIDKQVAA